MGTFAEFLTEGRLGGLAPGQNRSEVQSLLGKPEATARGPVEIWKYGALQVAFRRDPEGGEPSVASLSLFFTDDASRLPATLDLSGWWPTAGTKIQDLSPYIPDYDPERYREMPDTPLIRLGPDAEATFEDGRLHGVHFRRTGKVRGRQISVFLPDDVLSLLRKEAAARNVSVSVLCAGWIKERAAASDPVGARVRAGGAA
jgi:hypothetical protein